MTTPPVPTPKPQVKPSAGGTLSPEAQAAIAERAGQSGSSSSSTGSKTVNPGLINRGYDAQGNPVTALIYKDIKNIPYNQAYVNNLDPKGRAALQKKLLALGAYPKGYVPLEGVVSTEDYNAMAKIVNIGEQKGIGSIDKVIEVIKKDSKLLAYVKTGGFAPTATGPVLTDTKEAASNLNDFFLNMFNEKPSKAEITAYQTAINAREKTVKGGMTAQERNDIILSVANKRLSTLTSDALTGDTTAAGKLDEGQLGKRVREIRSQYSENGIPVSDKTVYNLAGKSFRSPEAWDTIQDDINRSAAMQWGKLAEGLKPGQTVRSRLQPYITLRSRIRGVPEDQIKTQDMTDVTNPDGSIKSPNDYKAMQYKSDEYLQGDDFKSVVLNDTKAVLRNFGVM